QDFNGYSFAINGKTDGHARLDASTQVMAPLVGALLHPAPKSALVIGLGTGSSAGWLAAVPGMERVDVVELEPAVVRVARDCAPTNHEVLTDPRVHLTIGDGREMLLTSDRRWDVIFSEPSNPYRAGIASLFTTEFYRAAAERLAPGGFFLQWLQAYEIDAEVVASVYTSLGAVFPSVETWATNNGDLLLVASLRPLRHDVARERRRLASEPYQRALADTWGVFDAEGLYSGFIASPAFARRMANAGAPPNVDDLPVIEFGFARDLGGGDFSIAQLRQAVLPAESRPAEIAGVDWAQAAGLLPARELMSGRGGPQGQLGAAASVKWLAERWQPPAGTTATVPHSLVGLLVGIEALADRGDVRAAAAAQQLAADRPVEADALLARLAWRRGERDAAVAHFVRAFTGYRHDPWPWPLLMERALFLALEMGREPALGERLMPALGEPFAVRMLERSRLRALAGIAARVPGQACRQPFHRLEPYPPWEESLLRDRATCYRRTGDPLAEQARRDLERFDSARSLTVAERLAIGGRERDAGVALRKPAGSPPSSPLPAPPAQLPPSVPPPPPRRP
ncbi:MAG TPA: fused MFS/spermidine synthase, partial [Thermoanaerobaculia bacterium]|nr:fused MFS/spermidine synthase [Thermoanaerobaculia bacterium]